MYKARTNRPLHGQLQTGQFINVVSSTFIHVCKFSADLQFIYLCPFFISNFHIYVPRNCYF